MTRPETPLPARLGRFLLLERLPAHGMVQPWIARREGQVELCVLEHLHPGVAEHPAAQGRFRRRAELASHLDHPNIIETRSTGEEGGTFCVTTELVLGVSLERLLDALRAEGRALPLPIFGAVAVRLLRALAHAHAATDGRGRALKIVHRHLAPRSVTLGFAGEVKLGDFSVARAEVGDFRTAPGTGVGTAAYMSPEQVRSAEVDHRSDLYAVSTLFSELLTGHRLVPEGPLIEMLRAIAEEPVPLKLRLQDGLHSGLVQVVERGLEKAPGDRWASAERYLAALEPALGAAAGAGREEVSRFVRETLPDEEQAALARLGRVRAAVSALSPPRPPSTPAVAVPAPLFAPHDEDAPPEPSVMTMPGVAAAPDPEHMPLTKAEIVAPSRAPSRRGPAGSPRPDSRPPRTSSRASPRRGSEAGGRAPSGAGRQGSVSRLPPWLVALSAVAVVGGAGLGAWWLARSTARPAAEPPRAVEVAPRASERPESARPRAVAEVRSAKASSDRPVREARAPEPRPAAGAAPSAPTGERPSAPAEKPAGERPSAPAEGSAEERPSAPTEGSAEERPSAPTEGSAEERPSAPTEGSAKKPMEGSAEEPAKKPMEGSADGLEEGPAKKPAGGVRSEARAASSSDDPPSSPPADDPLASLRAEVARLEADPSPRRFIALHARIGALARRLPPASRRRATRALEAAERAHDPVGLGEALRIVAAARED